MTDEKVQIVIRLTETEREQVKELASKETPLIYRFYLGENLNSLDVERNCHYQITICPEDDGLKGDGWRVDKGGIGFNLGYGS